MELVDHVLQHPLATVVHRDRLAKENLELIKFWEQDPYVMFKDGEKLLSVLIALPSFAEDLESCADDELDLREAYELTLKIAQELPAVVIRWENYTPLAKSVEGFYAVARSLTFDAEACRAGRLLEEILSAKTLRLVTVMKPSDALIADYVSYGERLIDTVEYYETLQALNPDALKKLRGRLLEVEVASLVASIS